MPSLITVSKLNGGREPFSVKKVYNSALRAGAPGPLAKNIARKVEKEVYQNIKTSDIFKMVKRELKKEDPQVSMRFDLKGSIRKLGPAGFIFEKYVKEILFSYGFEVSIDRVIPGRCADHEIDFIASRNGAACIGECKYRNNQAEKIDLNVCLKGFAVLHDIKEGAYFKNYATVNFLIVTNSRFTNQAIKYSTCQGIKLLGWKYPLEQGLESLIEKRKLYPVTILPSFKGYLIDLFAREGMVLAQDVLSMDIEKFGKKDNIPRRQLESLVDEANILMGYKK